MGQVGASPEASLRDRRRRQTRADIHESALRLCAHQNYDDVTVASIAAAAGVSPRTFFNYFVSKADAVVALPTLELRSSRIARFRDDAVREPAEVVFDLIDLLVDQLDDDPPRRMELRSVFALADANPGVSAALSGQFDLAQGALAALVAHRLGADAEPQAAPLIAALAMTTVRTALQQWAAADDDEAPGFFVRRTVEVLEGLGIRRASARRTHRTRGDR